MQRHAHRALGHVKAFGSLADAGATKRYRLHDVALRIAQPPDQALGVADIHCVGRVDGFQRLDHVLDRHGDIPAAAAKAVDHLVADDGREPGSQRSGRVPCPALEMHCQQHFLHNVLGLARRRTELVAISPRHGAEIRRDG